MNTPCWLTVSRLLLLPIALALVASPWKYGLVATASVVTLAGVTDALDGYLARRWGCVTAGGANLDLATDKLFVSIATATLAFVGIVPFWMPAVIIAREATVTSVRLLRFGWRAPASDGWGKAKLAASFAGIAGLLLREDVLRGGPLAGIGSHEPTAAVLGAAPWVMLAAVALTVLSGVNYLARYSGLVRWGQAFLPSGKTGTLPFDR